MLKYYCYKASYSSFFNMWRRNKSFSPVFGSNRFRFCSWMLPASENNLLEYTEDDSGAERYFLAKLARCGYVALFKFHQVNSLASLICFYKFSSWTRDYRGVWLDNRKVFSYTRSLDQTFWEFYFCRSINNIYMNHGMESYINSVWNRLHHSMFQTS